MSREINGAPDRLLAQPRDPEGERLQQPASVHAGGVDEQRAAVLRSSSMKSIFMTFVMIDAECEFHRSNVNGAGGEFWNES